MKKKKSLTPISIALQGLMAISAVAGYNQSNNYNDPQPPWSASGVTAGNGSTTAQYSGASATINRLSHAYVILLSDWEDQHSDQVMNGTLVVESWTWNPGCYSDCISQVWKENDTNPVTPTIFQPSSGRGAWAQIKDV